MPDLDFLTDEELTHKDKLVLLTAQVVGTSSAADLATALSMSVQSVRQSLAKGGRTNPTADRAASKLVQDAILEVCQMDRRSMRPQDWKLVAKVAAELHETGATPDEVRVRARNLPRRLHLPITPGSLDKYWSQLGDRSPFSPAKVYGR